MSAPDSGLVETHALGTATSQMGGASELRACVHLLQQGFLVFRSVTDHAPFDLIAYRDDRTFRVEVRTASSATREVLRQPTLTWPSHDEWDLVVFVGIAHIWQFSADVDRVEARRIVRQSLGLSPAATAQERAAEREARLERLIASHRRESRFQQW